MYELGMTVAGLYLKNEWIFLSHCCRKMIILMVFWCQNLKIDLRSLSETEIPPSAISIMRNAINFRISQRLH